MALNWALKKVDPMTTGLIIIFLHQLVCHIGELNKSNNNEVDGKDVPIPHFGIILEWGDFDSFSSKQGRKCKFYNWPYLRFSGLPGEQKTMFFKDPLVMHWNLNLLNKILRFLTNNFWYV